MNVLYKALATSALFGGDDHDMVAQFSEHMNTYGLSYGTKEEFAFRFEQFKKADKLIKEINEKNGGSYTVSHNKFSTLTKHEFKKVLGKKPASNEGNVEYLPTDNLTDSVDWRTKGAVNAVQDQGMCGSCWAFSATAAMEGAHFLQTGKLLKLAEQQFVDCAGSTGNEGCNGGLEVWAFKYAETAPLELEKDYPYTARDGKCKATSSKEVVKVTDYAQVPKKSVSQLKAAIDKQPTCVSVEADTDFQFYDSGILDTPDCGTDLDHAVTAVGYGTDNGKEYFLVRNSWGADWGEKGYIRIAADMDGKAGVCGILLDSSRPTTD